MTSEPEPAYGLKQCREDLAYYRNEYSRAETALTPIAAMVDMWRRVNIPDATDQLEALLEGEAGPVDEVIRHVLTAILHDLGVRGDDSVIERGGPPRGRWARDPDES